MKKKLILGLLVFVALFTITGCGSKKDDFSNNSESNNNESNNSSQKVASTLICTRSNSAVDMTMEFHFDKDENFIDGIRTIETTNMEDQRFKDSFEKDCETFKNSGYYDVTCEWPIRTGKFNADTSDFRQYKYYIGELNKANIKKYYEKTEKGDVWECK